MESPVSDYFPASPSNKEFYFSKSKRREMELELANSLDVPTHFLI